MTDTNAPAVIAKTAKVVEKAAATIATDNILPAVVETAEVAVQVPTKFVVSSKLIAGVVAGVALGAGGFYGVQKLRAIRAAKKAELAVPETVEDALKA